MNRGKFILMGLSLLLPTAWAQPSGRLFICPVVKGAYRNGQAVKNADDQSWSLSIPNSQSMPLEIPNWQNRYVKPHREVKKEYTLVCESKITDKTIRAEYIVKNADHCYVIPDVNYQLFGCF